MYLHGRQPSQAQSGSASRTSSTGNVAHLHIPTSVQAMSQMPAQMQLAPQPHISSNGAAAYNPPPAGVAMPRPHFPDQLGSHTQSTHSTEWRFETSPDAGQPVRNHAHGHQQERNLEPVGVLNVVHQSEQPMQQDIMYDVTLMWFHSR